MRGRLDRGYEIRGECKVIRQKPSAYLKRFTYDTISYSEDILTELVALVGADRILMGSDYCFDIAYDQPVKMITSMPSLTDQQKQAILGANAVRLLKL